MNQWICMWHDWLILWHERFCWWVLQHCKGFARLVWGRLRVHRAFFYSDWSCDKNALNASCDHPCKECIWWMNLNRVTLVILWFVLTCNMTHIRDVCECSHVTWLVLIHTCDVLHSHSHVWRDVTCDVTCDMTRSVFHFNMWHDSHMWRMDVLTCDMTRSHSRVWRASFSFTRVTWRVTWLTHTVDVTCDVTHSYMWRDVWHD